MKTKIFHGTSKENADLILKGGFCSENLLWNCSDDMNTYVWNLSKVTEYENEEDNINFCLQSAFDAGSISAALHDTKENYVAIFEMEIDNEELEDDDSCDNMTYASQINSDKLNELIKSGQAKIIKVHKALYYNSLRLFYLRGLKRNRYNTLDWYLSDLELQAIDILANSDMELYELMECEIIK